VSSTGAQPSYKDLRSPHPLAREYLLAPKADIDPSLPGTLRDDEGEKPGAEKKSCHAGADQKTKNGDPVKP